MKKDVFVHLAVVIFFSVAAGCDGGSGQGPGCPATFEACGGDPTGTWTMGSLCTEKSLAPVLDALLAKSFPACVGMVNSAEITDIGGTITYSSGTVISDTQANIKIKATYSTACLAAMGKPAASTSACASLQSIMSAGDTSASCTLSGTSCACESTQPMGSQDSTGYSIQGSTISEESGDTYEFCVKGNALVMRAESDTTGTTIVTLSKR